ncbi:metallophosphoesterase family protein [Sulfitobacter donghicola]|uniref:Serine/threonine protein phosphatase n=1 Tax=Sulfitobacter donghicola DSW-25 = KCTC 12864 = JCM 14565 TaxID=1300350 RepID=A0A073ILI9_9RHOB|nr:metallophosphoesterase family protein [Sulfitobacter donghicola]KEJ90594.1 serine/threonine protein phosphatase [Sulfitobacter donghicola DSW-25 = KCTC 12864 = JCM 14565]KIN67843.1 Bis(5'nucleosyl)-tetraphosphatase, ApaH [Sulfitobacter donghicola DSW-25 = KCTC 12864 = JCM 14565]
MTKPIYAIGDVHGQIEELNRVLALIEKDGGPDAEVVFIGDYTDRGANSAEVIDTLIQGLAVGKPWRCLMGNHDRMFSWFMRDYPQHDAYLPVYLYWLHERLGGDTTMASYGVKMKETDRQTAVHALAKAAVPQAHVDFLNNLSLSYETDDLFFAHAGIKPGVPLDQQDEEDLLWIRKEFHVDTRDHGKLIVHGHTPVETATHYGNRINIDAGAGYGRPLTAVVFEGRSCWTLSAEGRQPLMPVEANAV